MFINLNYLTNIKQLILINNFILFINLFILNINGQERAEVDIKVSGACSPIYLSRRGIDLGKYRPLIKFNPNKVQLIPKNPVIPGCVKIKAEGVEIIKPIKNLFAEVEMRIGGSPDPNNPTLPCTKRIDDKVNQCPCAKTEGSCVFCDFCRQLRAQQQQTKVLTEKTKLKNNNNKGERGEEYNPNIIISSSSTSSSSSLIEEQCKCETMQPGLYDIETEMCTPQLDDTKQYIPNELQNNILEKTPISMFITVYLMDLQTNPNESYLSAFGKAILQRRMAQNTVACFLMGLDVTLGSNNSNGGGEGNIEEEQNNNNKQQQQPTSSSDSS